MGVPLNLTASDAAPQTSVRQVQPIYQVPATAADVSALPSFSSIVRTVRIVLVPQIHEIVKLNALWKVFYVQSECHH